MDSDPQQPRPPFDVQRGFRRLWIAVGIPYFGGWALWGLVSVRGYNAYEAQLRKADATNSIEIQVLLDGVRRTSHGIEMSILWGLLVPLAVLVFTAAARWVYRGFKP